MKNKYIFPIDFRGLVFLWLLIPFYLPGQNPGDETKLAYTVEELSNAGFKQDPYWCGADGAATIDLENGKILWLFSDTFIDPTGTGSRPNSKIIHNSLAIQDGDEWNKAPMTYFYRGSTRRPKAFFRIRGKTWFWLGHGVLVRGQLILFLMEEKRIPEGLGFEAVGWYLAIVPNPGANPRNWKIKYLKGPDTNGIIVGSAAVLQDSTYLYAFGVKEPATHEVYLLRFAIDKLLSGQLEGMEGWTGNAWQNIQETGFKPAQLFTGQTEFSVHYDDKLKKYLQVQTFGFGQATIGYRLADQIQGPWSEPELIFTPKLEDKDEFVYTANAHPEIKSEGLIITYNVNNMNFGRLVRDTTIYYPRIIRLKFNYP